MRTISVLPRETMVFSSNQAERFLSKGSGRLVVEKGSKRIGIVEDGGRRVCHDALSLKMCTSLAQ